MLKCLQTHCVWYDFDMDARVMTLWYFVQGIIEICCLEIKKCARMVLFDRDDGGGRITVGLGWYEFIWKANTWPGSHMNFQSQRGADNPAFGGVVESILF